MVQCRIFISLLINASGEWFAALPRMLTNKKMGYFPNFQYLWINDTCKVLPRTVQLELIKLGILGLKEGNIHDLRHRTEIFSFVLII